MSKKSVQKRRHRAYFYLLINTICWGAALVIVKPALDFTTPFRFLFYRYLIAGLAFSLPYLYFNRKKLKKLKKIKLKRIILIELLGTILSLSILFYGLAHTSAIEASLIGTTGPIFITLAGVLLLKERQERWEWLGLLISLIGSILIVTTHNGLENEISLRGNLFVLTFNITNAIYFILAKKYYQPLDKTMVGAVSFLVGLVGFFLINLTILNGDLVRFISQISQDWTHLSVQAASVYMAVFGSVIGLISYIKGQDKIEASEAGLFTYLQPIIYLPLGILLLREAIYAQQIIGLMLVFLGVLTAEKRVYK